MTTTHTNYTPLEVFIALSLYNYNVPPGERSKKLYRQFEGACAEPDELLRILTEESGHLGTAFAFPTAKAYIEDALAKYGDEARDTVRLNDLMGQG